MKIAIISLVLGLLFAGLTFLSGSTMHCTFVSCDSYYDLNYKSFPFSVLALVFLVVSLLRLLKLQKFEKDESLKIDRFAENTYEDV